MCLGKSILSYKKNLSNKVKRTINIWFRINLQFLLTKFKYYRPLNCYVLPTGPWFPEGWPSINFKLSVRLPFSMWSAPPKWHVKKGWGQVQVLCQFGGMDTPQTCWSMSINTPILKWKCNKFMVLLMTLMEW